MEEHGNYLIKPLQVIGCGAFGRVEKLSCTTQTVTNVGSMRERFYQFARSLLDRFLTMMIGDADLSEK